MTPDAAFWDDLAERYAAKPVDDPDAFERKIEHTLAHIDADSVVLDIGCGTGSLALRLAPAAAEVHGLDLSPEMIRIARGKAGAAGAEGVHFHVGPFDASFDALAPGSVDVLCCYSILHLLPDRPAALARAFELLAPGGTFVSSTVCLSESWIPHTPLLWGMRMLGKAPHVWVISKARVAEEIAGAGFVDVRQPDVGAEAIIGFHIARKPS